MSEATPTDNKGTRVNFDSGDQAATLVGELLKTARREICFFGARLDPVTLDNDKVLDYLSEFARRTPHTKIRMVVQSTQKNIAGSHRLIRLTPRLSSSIHLHIAGDEQQNLQQMFLIIDDHSLLYCPYHDRYTGHVEFNAQASVQQLRQRFEAIWVNSHPDSNVRKLLI